MVYIFGLSKLKVKVALCFVLANVETIICSWRVLNTPQRLEVVKLRLGQTILKLFITEVTLFLARNWTTFSSFGKEQFFHSFTVCNAKILPILNQEKLKKHRNVRKACFVVRMNVFLPVSPRKN